MNFLRVLVDDVDDAIEDMASIGFELDERWGPPFAIVKKSELEVWLSGPNSTGAQAVRDFDAATRARASTHLVQVVDDLARDVQELGAKGWMPVGDEVSGPGGAQRLLSKNGMFVELFQPK